MDLVFDSMIFDKLISNELSQDLLKGKHITVYVTHIQIDQLCKTPDENKRAKLLLSLIDIRAKLVPTESFVIGYSRIGHGKITDGKGIIRQIDKANPKHTKDAMIGEVALKNNYTLITEDSTFKKKIIALGGKAMDIRELTTLLSSSI